MDFIHPTGDPMTTLDDIDFNELPIVVLQQGEVSVWKAWKRALCAFNDPQLWRDTSTYDQYFERLDSNAWTMAGYGVIVMDLDHRTAWSFNDFSSPWSLHLPTPSSDDSNPHEKKAFQALLNDRAEWKNVTLTVHVRDGASQEVNAQRITLDALMTAAGEGTPIDADGAMALLDTRDGEIAVNGVRYLMLRGRYLPEGWNVGCERGQDGPEGLLNALLAWKHAGLPAPSDWNPLNEFMTQGEYPVSDDDFAAYPAQIEEDDESLRDEMNQTYAGAQAYRALRSTWVGPAAGTAARPKGP